MNRETLRALGLSEEQIEAVVADHARIIQGVQTRLTAAENRANELNQELEQATNSDEIKELSERAEKAEAQAAEFQSQINQMTIDNLVNTALTEAGATDLEYARFKLGELELSEDGQSIADLDNKIKDLKANLPAYFEQSDTTDNEDEGDIKPPSGFERVGNDLKGGKQSEPDPTQAMIEAMTADITQTK